jgi:hypothetical protein
VPISPKFRRFSPKLRSISEILEATASVRIEDLAAFSTFIAAPDACRTKGLTILISIRLYASRSAHSVISVIPLSGKSANIAQNPMIAAQAIISMIKVNIAFSKQARSEAPHLPDNPFRRPCRDAYRLRAWQHPWCRVFRNPRVCLRPTDQACANAPNRAA